MTRAASRGRANVIRVSSLSKEWSAPGLKVGWFLADEAFVSAYYEYASSSYGGPASIAYTLVEVLARFENWKAQGVDDPRLSELRQLQADYGLTLDTLGHAYRSYVQERDLLDVALRAQRNSCFTRLHAAGISVQRPRCSINLSFSDVAGTDSYTSFRHVLRTTGVALYPGVLAFKLASSSLRLTTARNPHQLDDGLDALLHHMASPKLEPLA